MFNIPKNKKTFSRGDLDNYIKQVMTESEIIMTEQKDHIYKLKNENEKLSRELGELKKKEKAIYKALTEATKRAAEIEENAKTRCNIEIERVKQFSYKWNRYFSDLKEQSKPITEKDTVAFSDEIDGIAEQIIENSLFEEDRKKKEKLFMEKTMAYKNYTKLSPKEWINNQRFSDEEVKDTKLNDDLAKRFEKIMEKLKKCASGKLPEPSDSGFDFNEALNPKDSLDDILGDLL